MFFLLRTTFWLIVILAILPLFVAHDESQSGATKFSAGDAFGAATAAISDLSQFCTRKPEACEAGMQAAAAVGASAQTGVKILYGYIQSRTAADAEPTLSRTGTINPRKAAQAKPVARDSQNTLSTLDLTPAWCSPASGRDSGA
jgi:hypothetical protein